MAGKERIDKLLVQRQYAGSRERARALILAGRVIVDDQTIDKVGSQVYVTSDIRLRGEDIPYVSRGGLKLAEALKRFDLTIDGRFAIDVGASTGGFTDCLLQNGAVRVIAVDVGYGQLAWKLRDDDRVQNLERTNIRHLKADLFDKLPDLAVIDASFISLEKVLPSTVALLKPCSDVIALIKPQFEVGKGLVGKGGVVRDPDQHLEVIEKIKLYSEQLGCQVVDVCDSPLLGPKGNKEFLIHLRLERDL